MVQFERAIIVSALRRKGSHAVDLDMKIKGLFQQLDVEDKTAFLSAFETALKEQSSPVSSHPSPEQEAQ